MKNPLLIVAFLALAVFVIVSDRMRELLARSPDKSRLREVALEEGMTTLRVDGWRKVQAGITTIEEVLRVAAD